MTSRDIVQELILLEDLVLGYLASVLLLSVFLFIDCDQERNKTAIAAMNGSSGGGGKFCIPNGNEAIKFLGFEEVSWLLV